MNGLTRNGSKGSNKNAASSKSSKLYQKKTLETTLGKAPPNRAKVDQHPTGVPFLADHAKPDLSDVRKPLETSVFGLKQAIALLSTATKEIQDYISQECDLIYECKMCRSLFRSLANFILHKRDFCKSQFQPFHSQNNNGMQRGQFVVENHSTKEEPESNVNIVVGASDDNIMNTASDALPKTAIDVPAPCKRSISPIINRLVKRQRKVIFSKDLMAKDWREGDANEANENHRATNDIILESIGSSEVAMFQSSFNKTEEKSTMSIKPDATIDLSESSDSRDSDAETFTKTEVLELHAIDNRNETGILDSKGKISYPPLYQKTEFDRATVPDTTTTKHDPHILSNAHRVQNNAVSGTTNKRAADDKNELICTECNILFSTRKTLTSHIKYKHNETSTVYPCPDCHDTFANAWCVFRHLFKIHKRSNSQVRRLRPHIHASAIIRRDHQRKIIQLPKNASTVKTSSESLPKNWYNSGSVMHRNPQLCNSCGKTFERRAALNSHTQFCAKRLAAIAANRPKISPSKSGKDGEPKKEVIRIQIGALKRKMRKEDIQRKIKVSSFESDEVIELSPSPSPPPLPLPLPSVDQSTNEMPPLPEPYVANASSPRREPVDTSYDSELNNASFSATQSLLHDDGAIDVDKLSDESVFSIIGIMPLCAKKALVNVANKTDEVRDHESGVVETENQLMNGDNSSENQCVYVEAKDIDDPLRVEAITTDSITLCNGNEFMMTDYSTDTTSAYKDVPINTAIIEEVDDIVDVSSDESCVLVLDGVTDVASHTDNLTVIETPKRRETTEIAQNVHVQLYEHVSTSRSRSRSHSLSMATCEAKRAFEAVSSKRVQHFDNDGVNAVLLQINSCLPRGQNKCTSCDIGFEERYDLLAHMSVHYSWYRFRCPMCPFVTFHKRDCSTHMEFIHGLVGDDCTVAVLPITSWKMISLLQDFREIDFMKRRPDARSTKVAKKKHAESEDHHPSTVESTTKNYNAETNGSPIRSSSRSRRNVRNTQNSDFIYDSWRPTSSSSSSSRSRSPDERARVRSRPKKISTTSRRSSTPLVQVSLKDFDLY